MTTIQPYLAKYPFLEAAKVLVGEFDTDRMFEEEVLDRAVERVVRGVNNGKTGPTPTGADDDILDERKMANHEVELISYPTARILVSLLGDFRIVNRYARAEARTARNRMVEYDFKQNPSTDDSPIPRAKPILTLEEALEEYNLEAEETTPADEFHRTYSYEFFADADDDTLREFADTVFSIDSEDLPDGDLGELTPETLYDLFHDNSNREVFNKSIYRMPFQSYLRVGAGLNDDYWSLTNRGVTDGSLVITNEELMDLIEEAIFKEINERLPLDVPEALLKEGGDLLRERVTTIEEEIDDDHFAYQIDRVEEGVFPPVIKSMLDDFPDLKHEERVTLAAFFVHIGMNVDEILEFLGVKGTPGEAPTKYQVKHISTGGGSGEPYTPANYDTIEAWGYQWEKDALEASVKNPLTYYKIKLQEADEEEDEESNDTSAEANATEATEEVEQEPKSIEEMGIPEEDIQADFKAAQDDE